MLTDKEAKPLYDKVMGYLLNQRPYGEFFAIREIFGNDIAKSVAKRGDIIPPPGGLDEHGPPKNIQTTHDLGNDADDVEMDIIESSL